MQQVSLQSDHMDRTELQLLKGPLEEIFETVDITEGIRACTDVKERRKTI